ncbi:4856_t:CDS:2, partial [Acaulospora morrowiae]
CLPVTTIKDGKTFIARNKRVSFTTSSTFYNDPFGSSQFGFSQDIPPFVSQSEGFASGEESLQESTPLNLEERENLFQAHSETDFVPEENLMEKESSTPNIELAIAEEPSTPTPADSNSEARIRPEIIPPKKEYTFSRGIGSGNFQKLVDGIDEHGENWELISKEVFNDDVHPGQLKSFWNYMMAKHKNSTISSSRVYPFWTTKETEKLINAVDLHGEEWEKISIEIFNKKRSLMQCKNRWLRLQERQTQGERLKPFKKPSRTWGDKLKETSLWMTKPNQVSPELGDVLKEQCAYFVRALGQQFVKLDINFVNPREFPWTRKENDTLFDLIKKHGFDWGEISKSIPNRSIESIRERASSVTLWTKEEVAKFEEAYDLYQSDWAQVSNYIKTKTPGLCWSYWRTITGADLLEQNKTKKFDTSFHRAEINVTFTDFTTTKLSFIRHNTNDAYVLKN